MSKLVIFDTETTGLSEEDRIIQVGAIVAELDNKRYYEDPYDELCSCGVPIKEAAMLTHGIKEEDIQNKPPFPKTNFKKRFDELNNKDNYLIAHNLDFDKKMIEKEGYKDKIHFKLIDTLQCARHLYQINDIVKGSKLSNHKLQTFRELLFNYSEEEKEAGKYGVKIKAHDAIGDVVVLKMFLGELFLKTKKTFNIHNNSDVFEKMVELSKQPVEMKIIPFFKKHPNKMVAEIDKIDPSYIDYFYNSQLEYRDSGNSYFNKDLLFTLEKVVKNRGHL